MSRDRQGNGKGDRQRPLTTPVEQFNRNWEAVFGKSKTKVEQAFEETIEQHQEFFEQLVDHERECGK